MYKHVFKRILDLLISIIALPVLGIISLVVVPLIKKEDKGPAIYISDRIGKDEKPFNMYKFRTMKVNAPDIRTKDNETYNAEEDPRLTKVGRTIRKLSIDETPQILNVLKGDMSIIGPRPNLNDNGLHEFTLDEKRRLEVRPGITGYNQAFYRNSIPKEAKFKNDVFYVDNLSFFLDIKILIQTAKTILKKDNIYNDKSIEVDNESDNCDRGN